MFVFLQFHFQTPLCQFLGERYDSPFAPAPRGGLSQDKTHLPLVQKKMPANGGEWLHSSYNRVQPDRAAASGRKRTSSVSLTGP